MNVSFDEAGASVQVSFIMSSPPAGCVPALAFGAGAFAREKPTTTALYFVRVGLNSSSMMSSPESSYRFASHLVGVEHII